MSYLKEAHAEALRLMYQAEIGRRKVNIDNLSSNSVGVAEHPDLIETLDKEIEKLSAAKDKLEALNDLVDPPQKYI
jgi:hypothetical protein